MPREHTPKLTALSSCAGCAAKLSQQSLTEVLQRLPFKQDRNLLVGTATGDDAGVYRIDARRALVQTTDFFTPIVDDPFAYGQIAATNALSDVYAMGGRPLTALNLAGIPTDMVALRPPIESCAAARPRFSRRTAFSSAATRFGVRSRSTASRLPAWCRRAAC